MQLPSFLSKSTALAIAMVMTLSSTVAFAGKTEAAEFYKQAQTAYQNNDYKKAADLLEKAFAQDPDLIYMYNRILALKASGQPEEALRLFKIYNDPMSKDANKRFSLDELKQINASLESAVAEKKALEEKKQEEQKKQEDKSVKPPPQPKESDVNILGWSLIGGGSLLLVTGILFGIGEGGPFQPDPGDFPLGKDDDGFESVLNRNKIVTIVGYAGGLLLIGGGVLTFFMGGDDKKEAKTSTLMPYVGPDGGGAVWQFRF